MTKETQEALRLCWCAAEVSFPDKSTEFLLEIAADLARAQGIKRDCDCSDVADALYGATKDL